MPPLRPLWPALCLALLTTLATACSDDADTRWLIGDWVVAYNPRHEANDTLRFEADRVMSVHLADGRVIDGHYRIDGDRLLLDLAVPKRETAIRIRISPDHHRLIFANGAYYEKKRPTPAGQSPSPQSPSPRP